MKTTKEDRMCFAIFGSTNKVLKAEKILKENEISFKLSPTPKKLTAYCDIAVTFSESKIVEVKNVLDKVKIKVKAYYIKEGDDYVCIERL